MQQSKTDVLQLRRLVATQAAYSQEVYTEVPNYDTARDVLRSARKALGLSQEDAALLLGVNRTTYVAYERGGRKFSFVFLAKAAAIYGLRLNVCNWPEFEPDNVELKVTPLFEPF